MDHRTLIKGSLHDLTQCPDCGAWRSARSMPQHRTAAHKYRQRKRTDVKINGILKKLAEGKTRTDIAREYGCTLKAINRRIETFKRNCGANTREQMVAEAVKLGLI